MFFLYRQAVMGPTQRSRSTVINVNMIQVFRTGIREHRPNMGLLRLAKWTRMFVTFSSINHAINIVCFFSKFRAHAQSCKKVATSSFRCTVVDVEFGIKKVCSQSCR